MFQYAFGKYLEKMYPDDVIKFDTSYYLAKNAIREYSLDEAFGINLSVATKAEIRDIRGFNPNDSFLDKLVGKVFGRGTSGGDIITEDLDKSFCENFVASTGDAYYSGYWQSEEYFKAFREEIVRSFSVNESKLDDSAKRMSDEMSSSKSVAIHVRLEDYLEEKNYRVYGGICTKEYYCNALEYINKNCNPDRIYLFTTEVDKALSLLPDEYEFIPVQYDGQRDYVDLYLMTRCKHNIIANSTFSWWGAWLGINSDKVVICPEKWFNNHTVYNQFCSGWKKMPCKK